MCQPHAPRDVKRQRHTMKTNTKSVGVALLIATMAVSAMADGPRGYSHPSHHREFRGRSHDAGWVAPLLFLGLAGAVIGAAASQSSAPQPTYVQPPVAYIPPSVTYMAPTPTYVAPAEVAPAPAQPPADVWYFCRSVGQYYPYTQYCPEGWKLVEPTRP